MGRIIVSIVIVIVIIASGWYFWQKSNANYAPPKTNMPNISNQSTSNPAAPATQPEKTNMVSYTDQGFSPKEITVKVGTTVTWTNNNTGKQMWVASAPHPVHTDYPGFDAKQASAAGGTYFFTFDKVGDWKYHNHTNPTDFGIVHVTQ